MIFQVRIFSIRKQRSLKVEKEAKFESNESRYFGKFTV